MGGVICAEDLRGLLGGRGGVRKVLMDVASLERSKG